MNYNFFSQDSLDRIPTPEITPFLLGDLVWNKQKSQKNRVVNILSTWATAQVSRPMLLSNMLTSYTHTQTYYAIKGDNQESWHEVRGGGHFPITKRLRE